jgi:hypothetical protein
MSDSQFLLTQLQELHILEKDCLVIVRNNEDEPLKVGTLTGFRKTGTSEIPIVKMAETEYLCMGIVIPYSQEMFDFLTFLPPKKQWEILSKIKSMFDILR